MKQLIRRGGGVIVAEVPAPPPADRYVRVRNSYSLISSGTEAAAVSGTSGLVGIARRATSSVADVQKSARIVRELGLTRSLDLARAKATELDPIGYSSAGIVLDGPDDLPSGSRVACIGAGWANHAEIVSVPYLLTARLPDSVSLLSASFGAIACIAMRGIRRLDLGPGSLICVVGLGLIGQLTVRLLIALGYRTCCVDPVSARVQLATEGGAIAGAGDLDEISAAVTSSMPWRGNVPTIHGALICAASDDGSLLGRVAELVAPGGRVILVGDVPINAQRQQLYAGEIDVGLACSYGPGRHDPQYEKDAIDYPERFVPWTMQRQLTLFLELLGEKRIQVDDLVEDVVSLDEAHQAYESLREGRLSSGVAFAIRYESDEAPETSLSRPSESASPQPSTPREPRPPIGLGLIGAGSYVRGQHAPNLQKLSDVFEVRGIASKTGLSAVSLAEELHPRMVTTDHRELLDDPSIEAVLIATRHSTHASLIVDALNAGKHVFVEKPMCLTPEEGREVVALAGETGLVVRVGFNRRFAPSIQDSVDAFQTAGQSIESVLIRVNVAAAAGHWSFDEREGGRFVGEAVHFIDLAAFLLGGVTDWHGMTSEQSDRARIIGSCVLSNRAEGLATISYHTVGHEKLGKEFIEISGGGRSVRIQDYRHIRSYGLPRLSTWGSRGDKGQSGVLEEFAMAVLGSPTGVGADAQAGLLATRIATSVRTSSSRISVHLSEHP